MAMLDLHRSARKRETDQASKSQEAVASSGDKIRRKQEEINKAKTPVDFKRYSSQLTTLMKQRADAEKAVAAHQKKANEYDKKVRDAEQVQQKNFLRQQQKNAQDVERSRKALERRLATTSASMIDLNQRIVSIEDNFIAGVRDAVVADPVPRKYDVFLSHAFPDVEVAKELYAELVGRD